MNRQIFVYCCMAVFCCLSGCASSSPVQPWEKGNLAKSHMLMGSDPLDERFTQHIYASKEGASGGQGVGGGGCGCN